MSRRPVLQRTMRRRAEGEHKSNSVRDSAWEQQAEEAAARFVRRAPRPAPTLTPAIAASYRLPASPGVPLPVALRTDLENSLNANLREVRLHRDHVADAAAREENALAFAAGRDVFLGEAAPSLDTLPGRALIAHEITHVLQQTGRKDSTGRLNVTVANGPGEIQRIDAGSTMRRRLQIDTDKLATAHVGDDDNPDEFARLVEAVRSALGGELDETSQSSADLESAVLRKDSIYWKQVERSEAAAGFLFDVLKFTDRFAGAAAVLQHSLMLLTYIGVPEQARYYLTHVDPDADYFDKIAAQHPLLSHYWPDRFFDTFVVFLNGPTRDIPALTDAGGKRYADARREYFDESKTQTVNDNELIFAEVNDLNDANDLRIKELTRLRSEVSRVLDADKAPVAFRQALSTKVRDWSRDLQQNPLKLIQRIGARIEAIAQSALDFWDTVLGTGFSFELEGNGAADGDTSAPKVRAVPLDKLFTEALPDALTDAVTTFGKVAPDGELPPPSVYAAQVTAAVARLKTFARTQLETRLIERARKGAVKDDVAIALGWFLLWLQDFFQRASLYEPSQDLDYQRKFQGYPDLRFAHRLRLARRVLELADSLHAGKFAHWKRLREQAEQILQNKQEGRSRLAILGLWNAQRSAPISALADDFSGGFTGVVSALSASELANIYLLVYSGDLTRELEIQLANASQELRDPRAALQKKSVLNRAVEVVDASSRPLRYVAADWDYAENPNEEQDIGQHDPVRREKVFAELVKQHPKTLQLEQEETAKGRSLLFAASPYRAEVKELFLWSIPDPLLIFATLRNIEPLNTLIAAWSGQSLEQVHDLDNETWMLSLGSLADARNAIDSELKKVLDAARADLNLAMRRAASHERELIVSAVSLALPDYTGHADLSWDLPLDILSRIESFANWVVPREDQQPQLAALFLAIAPDLLDALKNEKRFDIITAYYGYLLLAAAGSEGARLSDLARVVPDQAERDRLVANRAFLDQLRTRFDAQRSQVQKRFGFKSGDGKTLKALVYEQEIAPHVPFVLNGVKYELQQVFREFHFNPPYGYQGTPAYRPAMMGDKPYETEYLPTGVLLFRMAVNGRWNDVTDKDVEALIFYSNLIEQQANLIGLEQVAEYSEKFAELTLDVVELVPGVGQGVAAARIVATVLQFIASGEWEDIKNLLTNDPKALLERIWNKLQEVLTPDNLWIFLLFGSQLFDWLKAKVLTPRENRAAHSIKPMTTMGKIIAKVRGIEQGFAKAWDWLEGHVQHPVHSFQAFVLSHPILALVLDLVADNLHRLIDLKNWLDRHDAQGGFYSTITDVQADFTLHMENLVNSIQHLQLPQKVVPTEQLVEAMLELVLSRLGTKGKVTKIVLGTLGILDEISALIAKELKDLADPNEYWRRTVIPLIETQFTTARDGLVNDIYDFLTDPPLSLQMKRPLTGYKVKLVTPEGDGFPEAEAYPDADVPLTPSIARPPSSGQPLTRTVRSEAERCFGHDFSHVRLHTGSEASTLTRSVGAAGLTSGSHVYLDPSVSLGSSRGRHILNHELTHVLQQTGARPLGLNHSSTPRAGRDAIGLHLDPSRESAAERVANSVAQHSAREPIHPGPSGSGGFQPAGLSTSIRTARRFLRELTDVEKAKQAQREIDREAQSGGIPAIEADQVAIGRELWDRTQELISTTDLPKSAPNLQSIRTEFLAYFDGVKGVVSKVVPQIAFGASEPVQEKAEGEQPPVTRRKLKASHFVGALEDYLLARSGIVVSIKLGKSDKVESVQVKTLLLDMIGSSAALWTLAMTNSGITGAEVAELRPYLRAKLRELNTKTTYIEMRESGFPELKFVWASGQFAFNSNFVEDARARAKAQKTQGRPHDLPEYSHYLRYQSKASGSPGIRIGRYGDAAQKAPDRESHHTTQFLLIEYFRNKSTNQPFPAALRPALTKLGVRFGSGGVADRLAPAVGEPVNFKELDVGERGDAMPAILLARITHRTAGLHISGASSEDLPEGGIPVTQGEKVHATFMDELASASPEISAAYPSDLAKMSQYVDTIGPAIASARLFSAVQATYQWMHNHMLPALERGLRTQERDYYQEIVEVNHTVRMGSEEKLDSKYDLQPDHLETVYSAAEENNDRIMGEHGWKAP